MTPDLLDSILADCKARGLSPTQWVSSMRPAIVARLKNAKRGSLDTSGIVGAVAHAIGQGDTAPSYYLPSLRTALAGRIRELRGVGVSDLVQTDKRRRLYWITGRVWFVDGDVTSYGAPAHPMQVDGMDSVVGPAIWLFASQLPHMRAPWGDWFAEHERRARVALSADGGYLATANSPDNAMPGSTIGAGVHVALYASEGAARLACEVYQRDHERAPLDVWAVERSARLSRMVAQLGKLDGTATVQLAQARDAAEFDAIAGMHHAAGTLLHRAIDVAQAAAEMAPADKPAFPTVQPVDDMRTKNLEWSPEDA